MCVSAAGNVIPPMVIFKGEERLNHELTKGEVPDMLYGLFVNGWIDHEFFFFIG